MEQSSQSTQIPYDLVKPDRYARQPIPDDAWERFAELTREWDIPVTDEHRAKVEALYSHLVGVNAWMNLTRITKVEDYLLNHILDCLTVLPDVQDLSEPGDLCADLGSGAGYPGLPLMVWEPDRHWALVESRRKKAAFLEEAVKLTGCSTAEVHAIRANEARKHAPQLAEQCQLVLARAAGKLQKVLSEAAPLLKEEGALVVMKGRECPQPERDSGLRTAADLGLEQVVEYEAMPVDDEPGRLRLIFLKKK